MSLALRRHATQFAVFFDAFHEAANCERVTSKLFELEPAPLHCRKAYESKPKPGFLLLLEGRLSEIAVRGLATIYDISRVMA